jgi:hypothetical protein
MEQSFLFSGLPVHFIGVCAVQSEVLNCTWPGRSGDCSIGCCVLSCVWRERRTASKVNVFITLLNFQGHLCFFRAVNALVFQFSLCSLGDQEGGTNVLLWKGCRLCILYSLHLGLNSPTYQFRM